MTVTAAPPERAAPERTAPERAAVRFASATATGSDWGTIAKTALDRLGDVEDCNLGFLYVTDALAGDAVSIVTLLRGVTGIRHWVGTVGIGVCGVGEELFDQPAMAVMAARLPPDSFRLFPAVGTDIGPLGRAAGSWLDHGGGAMLGLVHADPRAEHLPHVLDAVGKATGAFLVGGLTSTRGGEFPQFTDPQTGGAMASTGPVAEGGASGVLFRPEVAVATGLSQGCSPIGPTRTITACEDNVVMEIDGRPALEVFKEDIGELLARDLRRVAGYIFAALPIAGSDTGDYLVRNLIAIDQRKGWLAIAESVAHGQPILFARRDRASAEADLRRMLGSVRKRLPADPKGAVYVSCLARGPNLFGPDSRELAIIREEIGDVPLAGFFASGEISHGRLYGYTGVLTLFV